MPATSRDDVAAGLATQRVLPLFNCGDEATGMAVLESLHAGGIRFVEFTNRAAGAVDVFRGLVAEAARRLPEVVLGAGTIIDRRQAEEFHAAGARFLVAPNLDEEVGAYCSSQGIFWCPGTATVTEMVRAHRLGAPVVKVFPADTLGGPAFIKAVRGPCPWLRLMPSGGVTADEANLRAWFEAGAHCVGMGSHLVDPRRVASGGDEARRDLADRVGRLVSVLAKL